MKHIQTFICSFTLLLLTSCGGKTNSGEKTATGTDLQAPFIPDTAGISKDRIAGTVEVLNKALVNNDLILVNDGSNNNRVYLMNKSAVILHEWELGRNLGKDANLMPDGSLLAMMMTDTTSITFGGQAGVLQIINPDNTIAWEHTYAAEDYITHHDAELLPNGNILTLVWERKPYKEAKKAGATLDIDLFPEAVIEIDPKTGEIVWEWHAWDHLVQDEQETAATYGSVSGNPQLIDLNFVTDKQGDIMHANGIAYDPVRDLIYLTLNWYSEVWVIDHSTSTIEAASHSGGNYNKGGDLIYRFGNPRAYGNEQGTPLFDWVHSPIFVEDAAAPYTRMLVFSNNMGGKKQSIVYEVDLSGDFSLKPDTNNEPAVLWSFTDPALYGGKISGAARQSNGNTLITEGDFGIWEVSPDKEVVWKFQGEGAFFWRAYPFDKDAEELRPYLP